MHPWMHTKLTNALKTAEMHDSPTTVVKAGIQLKLMGKVRNVPTAARSHPQDAAHL